MLARNCKIIDDNLEKLNAFFDRHADLFDWRLSDASCMAFPRYRGADGVEHFTQRLLEEAGVLLLPGSIYSSELAPTPLDRFRIGFGRSAIDDRNRGDGCAPAAYSRLILRLRLEESVVTPPGIIPG